MPKWRRPKFRLCNHPFPENQSLENNHLSTPRNNYRSSRFNKSAKASGAPKRRLKNGKTKNNKGSGI
jgi:hypothetical protein